METTPRYSPPPLSAISLATPTAMTLSTSHAPLKDDLTFGSSSDVAAALAKSSWKQETSELAEGSSSSSTHKSDRSMSHVKGRSRTARGGKGDQSSFLAISSSSSSSSSDDDDDDYYGQDDSSPSQSQVVTRNLRTLHSRTPSSTSATPPKYLSATPRFPAVSRNNGSRFSESEDEDEEDEDDSEDGDDDEEDDDDDIPLAKRIPGALTVQKSIRRQVRQGREKKKQENALRDHAETTRTRVMTLRPGASPSSLHDTTAALVASQTTTDRNLTRNGSRSLNPYSSEDSVRKRDINGPDGVEASTNPVDAASLYQRLNSLHRSKSMTKVRQPPTTEALPPVPFPESRPPSSHTQRSKNVKELPYHYHTSPSPTPINSAYAPSSKTPLRPMRSLHFHRPSIDYRPIGMDDPSSVPLPLDAEKRIIQNSTNINKSQPSTREGPKQQTSTFPTATPTHHQRSRSGSRSTIERTLASTIPEPVPPIPTTARISHGEYHNFCSSFILRIHLFCEQGLAGFLQMLTSIQRRLCVNTDQHHRYRPQPIIYQ